MAGWEHEYTKKSKECNSVRLNYTKHEPSNHEELGKKYKQRSLSPTDKLIDV